MTELCKSVLSLNVDCVAHCPVRANLFATGLYQLKPDSDERVGGVNLHKIEKRRMSRDVDRDSQEVERYSDSNQCSNSNQYSDSDSTNVYRIRTANTNMNSDGVFQIKWLPDKFALCSILSTGSLNLYDFDESESEYGYKFSTFKLSADQMLLDLDLIRIGNSYKFVVSDNVGGLRSGNIDSALSVSTVSHWSAHNSADTIDSGTVGSSAVEVWCCCFNPHDSDLIYSGSECGDLKAWDLRQQRDSVDRRENFPLFQNHGHHAGLTSIACHPENQNLVFTGGYDDTINVWDIRRMKKHRPLAELNLGGGVWRIKFDQSDSSKLLCSCMYNGWAVLNVDGSTNLHIINSTNYDNALLYGIDWCPENVGQVLCCTFYDNTVRLIQLPEY